MFGWRVVYLIFGRWGTELFFGGCISCFLGRVEVVYLIFGRWGTELFLEGDLMFFGKGLVNAHSLFHFA